MNLVILLIIAVIILYRLYTILGSEDGYKPKIHKVKIIDIANNTLKKIVPVEKIKKNKLTDWPLKIRPVIKKIAVQDAEFNYENFIDSAGNAFEIILSAYQKNDITVLKKLLAKKIFKIFQLSTKQNENSNENIRNDLVKINSIEVLDAQLASQKIACIKLKFKFEQVCAVYNDKGEIIKGSATDIMPAEDIWIFERDFAATQSTWFLAGTE